MESINDIINWEYDSINSSIQIIRANGNSMRLYCPSESKYNLGSGPFYCYSNIMSNLEGIPIASITYSKNPYCTKFSFIVETIYFRS